MDTPLSILQTYWGYRAFRPLQEEIIQSVLSGNDTLALMPTGGGKSVCYQVPALLQGGLCLVITPLVALMKDQVGSLKQKNIPVLSIHAGMPFREIERTLNNALHGDFRFLYISPERLETRLFREYAAALGISLIAVDEAHCISQWGYDFRPAYLKIARVREQVPHAVVLALTATATLAVQDDICARLEFKGNARRFQQSYERKNLSYSVFHPVSKKDRLLEIVNNVSGSGIVYCKTRKRTQEVEALLHAGGIQATHYHAGIEAEARSRRQEDWLAGKVKIMACTNAFGMGIDKPDVRLVVHYDLPDSLENYYQEAGRAGRDGSKAYAVLLYAARELRDLAGQAAIRFPAPQVIKKIYAALVNYFQLPAGAGQGLSFPFDLADFSRKFELGVTQVTFVLHLLAQEELLEYQEGFYAPPTAVFSATRSDLAVFAEAYPRDEGLIQGLLRSYEGILDRPVPISERTLARTIRQDRGKVSDGLARLCAMGLLDYRPGDDRPRIVFLTNRPVTRDLRIDQEHLRERKSAFEERTRAMAAYTLEERECRSQLLGRYFNDLSLPRCGICDNCLAERDRERNEALP